MGWFTGSRQWLGTGRFGLIVDGFFNHEWGVVGLVLSGGGHSTCMGGWCVSSGVGFLGGFLCGGVRFVVVGR